MKLLIYVAILFLVYRFWNISKIGINGGKKKSSVKESEPQMSSKTGEYIDYEEIE